MGALKQRNNIIDYIKGIGIVFMVMGHAGAPFTSFLYLFHMAIFFIASGYCYNKDNASNGQDTLNYIVRKIRNLWLPYVLWMTIFSVTHNLCIKHNIYTNNPRIFEYLSGSYIRTTEFWSFTQIVENIIKACLLRGDTRGLAGAFWFLATLLEISVFYNIVESVLRNVVKTKYVVHIQSVISMIFLFAGYAFHVLNLSVGGAKGFSLIIAYFTSDIFLKFQKFMKITFCREFDGLYLLWQ